MGLERSETDALLVDMHWLRIRGRHVHLDDLVLVDTECKVAVRVEKTVLRHYVMTTLHYREALIKLHALRSPEAALR